MCTLSIFRDDTTLKITMNRDERLNRACEIAPYLWDGGIVAPQDMQSQGTWIGMHPTTQKWACLLNGYADSDQVTKANRKSRGDIIPQYLTQRLEDFHDYIEQHKHAFASFRLVYGDQGSIYEMTWDCEVLRDHAIEYEDGWVFRSSSSYKQEQVVSHRQGVFQNWYQDPMYDCAIGIPSFHVLCDVDDQSSSILMRRDNPDRASTSITMIEIGRGETCMHYVSSQAEASQFVCALTRADIHDHNIKTLRYG